MDADSDEALFDAAIKEIHEDFEQNPLNYGNEDLLIPEMVYRLRRRISPEYVSVDYRQEYPNIEEEWRVRDFADRVEETGMAARVRPEVLFVHEGERWSFERSIKGRHESTVPKYDIVVFGPDGPMVGQSKAEGPGNYWDTESSVSVICEIKHSKNESSNFYAPGKGADDVRALANFPGNAGKRVFLFMDWWPVDGNGRHRFEPHRQRLVENVGNLPEPVEVVYLSRLGDCQSFTIE
jgi:hypothetical protein